MTRSVFACNLLFLQVIHYAKFAALRGSYQQVTASQNQALVKFIRKASQNAPRKAPNVHPVDTEVLAYLSIAELAELAGVDQATARRWKARKRLPEPVRRLLELTALGRLDVFGWKGWRLVHGELVSPEGWTFDPGHVMSLPILREQLRTLHVERRKFLGLESQPEPSHDADELLARIGGRSA